MNEQIIRRIYLQIIPKLKEYLDYDFEIEVFENRNDKNEGIIRLTGEEHFELIEEDLLIIVNRDELRFFVTDFATFEEPDLEVYKLINDLNRMYEYVKISISEIGIVCLENSIYTGQFTVINNPYLLSINLKKFIKDADDISRIFFVEEDEEEALEKKVEEKYTKTVNDALEVLKVSRTTIQRWLVGGYIDSKKINGKWKINNESLMNFKKRWDSRFERTPNNEPVDHL